MSGPSSHSSPSEAPWRAGLRAARANLVPGLVLQAIALVLVLAYYWHPPTRAVFDQLTAWRARSGLLFSIVGTALCGGVIPVIYLRLNPATRAGYTWKSFVFLSLLWAAKGIELDYWYRFLAWWVGNDTEVRTVAIKVFLDQVVYCPLWAVPVTVVAYAWHATGFQWAPLREDFRAGHWYWRHIMPGLLANLGLWVPLTCLIYALPLSLQLPLFDLVLVFYTLLIAHITRRKV